MTQSWLWDSQKQFKKLKKYMQTPLKGQALVYIDFDAAGNYHLRWSVVCNFIDFLSFLTKLSAITAQSRVMYCFDNSFFQASWMAEIDKASRGKLLCPLGGLIVPTWAHLHKCPSANARRCNL